MGPIGSCLSYFLCCTPKEEEQEITKNPIQAIVRSKCLDEEEWAAVTRVHHGKADDPAWPSN